jgi:hypothetical protein
MSGPVSFAPLTTTLPTSDMTLIYTLPREHESGGDGR